VLAFYGRDLLQLAAGVIRGRKKSLLLAGTLAAATVPVAVFGLLAGEFIESLFQSVLFVSVALAFTGTVLFFFGGDTLQRENGVSFRQGLLVGLFQILALFPGVSRSGTTICAGLRAGLSREEAARFSFLLSIPAIAGAAVMELPEASWSMSSGVVIAGFLVSAAVGFLALTLLVRFVRRGKLRGFAWYCWAVSAIGLLLAVTSGAA
jgi:undecaprenyl-diphosphatase